MAFALLQEGGLLDWLVEALVVLFVLAQALLPWLARKLKELGQRDAAPARAAAVPPPLPARAPPPPAPEPRRPRERERVEALALRIASDPRLAPLSPAVDALRRLVESGDVHAPPALVVLERLVALRADGMRPELARRADTLVDALVGPARRRLPGLPLVAVAGDPPRDHALTDRLGVTPVQVDASVVRRPWTWAGLVRSAWAGVLSRRLLPEAREAIERPDPERLDEGAHVFATSFAAHWAEALLGDVAATLALGSAFPRALLRAAAGTGPGDAFVVAARPDAMPAAGPPLAFRVAVALRTLERMGLGETAAPLETRWLAWTAPAAAYELRMPMEIARLQREVLDLHADFVAERLLEHRFAALSGGRLQDLPGLDATAAVERETVRVREMLEASLPVEARSPGALVAAAVGLADAAPQAVLDALDASLDRLATRKAESAPRPARAAAPATSRGSRRAAIRDAIVLGELLTPLELTARRA